MSRIWVKLDATYTEDERIMEAGALAELVFVRSLAYCRRRVTDGAVTPAAARSLCIGIPETPETLIAALVDSGLWVMQDNGWRVRSYDSWQQTSDVLKAEAARKKEERDKKRKGRAPDVLLVSDGRPADEPKTPAFEVGRDYLRAIPRASAAIPKERAAQ